MMRCMIQAAIFDMDGLMVDTEPLQGRAFVYAVEKYSGVAPEYDGELIHTVGVGVRDNVEKLIKQYGMKGDIEEILSDRSAYYETQLPKVRLMPGVVDLIDELKQEGVLLAVASSSDMRHIDMVLQATTSRDNFLVIMSGDEVRRGKPDPEIFLAAAERLGVSPLNCVVFEDTAAGLQAGLGAGMKVVVVPSRFVSEDVSAAHLVVESLKEVSWYWLCFL